MTLRCCDIAERPFTTKLKIAEKYLQNLKHQTKNVSGHEPGDRVSLNPGKSVNSFKKFPLLKKQFQKLRNLLTF